MKVSDRDRNVNKVRKVVVFWWNLIWNGVAYCSMCRRNPRVDEPAERGRPQLSRDWEDQASPRAGERGARSGSRGSRDGSAAGGGQDRQVPTGTRRHPATDRPSHCREGRRVREHPVTRPLDTYLLNARLNSFCSLTSAKKVRLCFQLCPSVNRLLKKLVIKSLWILFCEINQSINQNTFVKRHKSRANRRRVNGCTQSRDRWIRLWMTLTKGQVH